MDVLTSRCAWAIKTIQSDKNLDKGITDIALAKILGTDKNTLSRYRREKGLLKGEVIDNLVARYNFSPQWLFKGQGEPFPGARAKYPEVCGLEPAPLYNNDASPPAGTIESQKINIEEAIGKAWAILSSGTPYAVALYLNIQQFSSALDAIKELHLCQDRITNLETQVDALRRQVDRLTAPSTTPEQQEAS